VSPEAIDNFLSLYIRSLLEESRNVQAGPRFGLDRIIHQLALADGHVSVRLPFFREGGDKLPKPKKEAEHGVDMSFLSRDRKTFLVFVIKDETLTYRNFISHGFDKDLRLAAAPDLDDPSLANIETVKIILTYNKDEDEEGVENFNRLVKTLGTKAGDRANLVFERWNLTTITSLVKERLMTPSLLPDSFFRKFSYICAQFGDFDATSPHWNELLVPDWREFLSEVLKRPINETNIRLVSIALIVLRQHAKLDEKGKVTRGALIGWIELVEWAMLSLWNAAYNAPKKISRQIIGIVGQFWVEFYLMQLHEFYQENAQWLAATHSLEIPGDSIEDAGGSYRAHWHLGRLGILAMAIPEIFGREDEQRRESTEIMVHEITKWLVQFLNACPSCYRPMLDIQHIEQFLVWRALAQVGRWDDIQGWLTELTQRLQMRYHGVCDLPAIDYRNSWELLMDSLSGTDPKNRVPSGSSYFILMLMELSLTLPDARGNELVRAIYKIFVEDPGTVPKGPNGITEPLDLIGWSPPADWSNRVLSGDGDGGHGISVAIDKGDPASSLRNYISKSRDVKVDRLDPPGLPSVFVLACIRHRSPLPSFFWRQLSDGSKDETKSTSEKHFTARKKSKISKKMSTLD
jgi:hypothetical protein